MVANVDDRWSSGEHYESYVGRWSRPVAREFVRWLAQPASMRWLDVGCGTGILTATILEVASAARVTGVDPSPGFLEFARDRVPGPSVSFELGDAQALPVGDGSFDAVVSGLVLNFVPDRPLALAEARRAAVPGGVVAAYVWDYPEAMWLMRHFWDAAVALDPAANEVRESTRFPFCRPPELEALFAEAGLARVESRAIVVPTVFESFDDYWSPFLGGTGPAPSYLQSLDESQRDALRNSLRERLPVSEEGDIRMTARAWAVRGFN